MIQITAKVLAGRNTQDYGPDLQQLNTESATELVGLIPNTIQEDFLWDLCDNTNVERWHME